MISLPIACCLVAIHWVMDFVCQSDYMAVNKSKNINVLAAHCAIYAAPFIFFNINYAVLLFMSHFLIDFCTSRGTSYLWKHKKVHEFFVLIGFDQVLHHIILFVGYCIYVK